MLHSPRCIIGTSLVNYVPTTNQVQETETVNATGAPMLCQENVKIKCFKTLKPRPLAGAAFSDSDLSLGLTLL